MEKYNPYIATALKRQKLSSPMSQLLEKGFFEVGDNILDFGCGNGDDVRILRDRGYDIVGYDKYNNEFSDKQLLNKQYDIVTCNYCLNTIIDLKEHNEVLCMLKKISSKVFISVRCDKRAVRDNWRFEEEKMGYFSKRSFQRFYDKNMIEKIIGEVEYIHNCNGYMLFKLVIPKTF